MPEHKDKYLFHPMIRNYAARGFRPRDQDDNQVALKAICNRW